MELDAYMKLMKLNDYKADNRWRASKITKNMKTRLSKFVVAAKPKHRRQWTFSNPFKFDPLKFGSAPRHARL
jgi:hypothetical protein